jgi:hypothetical protein
MAEAWRARTKILIHPLSSFAYDEEGQSSPAVRTVMEALAPGLYRELGQICVEVYGHFDVIIMRRAQHTSHIAPLCPLSAPEEECLCLVA